MKTLAGTSSKKHPTCGNHPTTNRLKLSLWLVLVCLCPLLSAGCGKIGDPLPPLPRAPLNISELNVVQQGSQLLLSFPIVRPARAERLERIDIFRLIEPEAALAALTQEDFATRASVIASIPGDQVKPGTSTVTYADPLNLPQLPKGQRYRYAVRLFNRDGRAADFSNYAFITPLTELAAAPTQPQASLSQTELVLTWSAPTTNENGTSPANVAGYNLYRKVGENYLKLNPQPLREGRFVEKGFQFGQPYEVLVRTLSFTPGNANLALAIEGNASAPLVFTPKDTFPPAAPTSLTIASINAQVSLFWPSNAEADLAGYNIYRVEDENAPAAQWLKLNPKLHTPTTFRDNRVQVGKRYFYQLTAVDNAGNESPRSETISEIVNP